MARPGWRHRPLTVECAIFLSFGAPIGMLGAGWPEARHLFDRSTGSLGVVAAGYGLARLVTAPAALPILRRWRIRPATTFLAAALSLSAVATAVTRSFPVLVVTFTLIGVASGCLDALGARFQTIVRHVGSAGLMFGAYGVGATIGPLLIARFGWTPAFAGAGVIAGAAALLAASPRVDWPDGLRRAEPPTGDHHRLHVPAWVVALSLSLFGIYCGLEVTTGTWGASYLDGARGLAPETAALAMSGFWAGMTLGRLGLGAVAGPGRRLDARQLLVLSGAAATVVYLAMPLVPDVAAAALMTAAGLALAGMFPTLMSTTADRVGVGPTGRVMGWQLLSANVTELAMSAAVGVGVNRFGAGVPAGVLAVMAVVGLPLLWWSTSLHAADGATEPIVPAAPVIER